MHKRFLSKKERRELSRTIGISEVSEILRDSDEVVLLSYDRFSLYVADGKPILFELRGVLYPTLYILNVLLNQGREVSIPYVVVDEGAVNPLINGADVMAPGISRIARPFSKGEVVAVMHPSGKYFIVVGHALMDFRDVESVRRGKAIKNVHRLNDKIWQISLDIVRKGV